MKRIMLLLSSRGSSIKEISNNDNRDELKKNNNQDDEDDDDEEEEAENNDEEEDDGDDEAEEEEENNLNDKKLSSKKFQINNNKNKPKEIFTSSSSAASALLINNTNNSAMCLYDNSSNNNYNNYRIYNEDNDNDDDIINKKSIEQRLDFGSLQCATKVFESAVESFGKAILCQDSWNILEFLLGISLLFWGIVLEIRGCPALTVMFFFSFIYIQFGNLFFQTSSNAEQFMNRSMEKIRSISESLKELVQQCTVICFVLCVCMLTLWLDGSISDVLLIYTFCMSLFIIGPGHYLQNSTEISSKEWENEIDEFLPVVTEDNMKLLRRAGDNGESSSTPTTPDYDNSLDTFIDDDFTGLKIPSHEEDGSTDGMEFSELELNNVGETETDGIKIPLKYKKNNKKNLEHSNLSSSDEDDDLDLKITNLSDDDNDNNNTDNEFEFIDIKELSNIKNV